MFKIYLAILAGFFIPFLLIAQDTSYHSAGIMVQSKIVHHPSKYFQPAGIIIPGSFLLYGCLKPVIPAIKTVDDKLIMQVRNRYPEFYTPAADYLMWAPTAAIYLMDAAQLSTKHSFKEHVILDAGSLIVTGCIGLVMRKISGNIAVYKTQGTDFPSGHTANAFRTAEIFHQELKEHHLLLSYAGYIVATGVGAIRIYNKDHVISEVLAGAGLGILSTKLTYLFFDAFKLKKKRK